MIRFQNPLLPPNQLPTVSTLIIQPNFKFIFPTKHVKITLKSITEAPP